MSKYVAQDTEAFCLHVRPYKESSALVRLFTRSSGQLTVVAKGIKSNKRSKNNLLLQPFIKLKISYLGKNELKTLTEFESLDSQMRFEGKSIFAAMYLNELLSILLPISLPYEDLYELYIKALVDLVDGKEIEPVLRVFERNMLEQLGYAIDFSCPVSADGVFDSESYYTYRHEVGFIRIDAPPKRDVDGNRVFLGRVLDQVDRNQLDGPEVLKAAKALMRLAITPLLDGAELNSKQLFV